MLEQLGIVDYLWFFLGLFFLLVWLYRSRWGRDAFVSAPVRQHQLQSCDLLIMAVLYLLALSVSSLVLAGREDPSWARQNLAYLLLAIGQVILAIAIAHIASRRFRNSLAGFGLSCQAPMRILGLSLVYFITAFGLSMLTFTLSVQVGKIFGYDLIQKHPILDALAANPPLASLLVLALPPALVTPVAEEFMFRGLVQSFLIHALAPKAHLAEPLAANGSASRAAVGVVSDRSRWVGIAVTALIFALFHGQCQHWPALFVLGLCLGYSYERHGNLLIPIFMHSFFNILPLVLAILGANN